MTTLTNYFSRLLLILISVSAVSIGTAAAQPGGHLVILRSPNFGWNLAFNLEIDGRPVTNVVQGRQYHTWLPAGEHVLTVRKLPRTGISGPTSTTVNVQRGLTYVYTAIWDSDFVFLRPSGLCITPGELWQDGWPARPNCAWLID
jgi:hypothetical protein